MPAAGFEPVTYALGERKINYFIIIIGDISRISNPIFTELKHLNLNRAHIYAHKTVVFFFMTL